MRAPLTILLAVALSVSNAQASHLESRVKRLIAQSPASRQGFAGVLVVDENGRKLVSINAEHTFIPASNTKLFSTALALERLGPDKRFETRVEQRGDDLVLIGTGDANLSGRLIPYQYNSRPGPALAAIDDLVSQIASHGIREVRDVLGDDTAFVYEPFAAGWATEDVLYEDGAAVGALVVNDDVMDLHVIPGARDGMPVQLTFNPPLTEFQIENHAITGPVDDLHTDRVPGTALWRIWGSLPVSAKTHIEQWAAPDPAQFAADALKYSLEQHGIRVTGTAKAIHRLAGVPYTPAAPGTVVAKRESPPLLEDLRIIDKTSQNQHADLLLFDMGGSREDGLNQMEGFLGEIGVPPVGYRFYDGSGLSRMNLVTPQAVVTLLRFMARSPHAEDWMTLLPVSGVDGSLATRLTGARVKGRIHAKTGSLNHVSALSGYADRRKGGRLAFSIFVNNATGNTTEQRELIDKICTVLVE